MAFDSSAQSYWQAGGGPPQWLSWRRGELTTSTTTTTVPSAGRRGDGATSDSDDERAVDGASRQPRAAGDGGGTIDSRSRSAGGDHQLLLCGYAITVRREDCCVNAHSPTAWQLQRAPLAASAAASAPPPAGDRGQSAATAWTVLHEVSLNIAAGNRAAAAAAAAADAASGIGAGSGEWAPGERRAFLLDTPSPLNGRFQYRLLLLAVGSPSRSSTAAEGEGACVAGANGTEAWRGRHRCNQQQPRQLQLQLAAAGGSAAAAAAAAALAAWVEWVRRVYAHAWHHGSQAGGAPADAPVLAGWELLRCTGLQQQHHQHQHHYEEQDSGVQGIGYIVDTAEHSDCKCDRFRRWPAARKEGGNAVWLSRLTALRMASLQV